MKKGILLISIILVLCTFIPATTSVLISPGTYFTAGTGNYTVGHQMNFSQIKINANWIAFNITHFNISSANTVYVVLYDLDDDPLTALVNEYVLNFSAATTAGNVWFNLSGFRANANYTIYRNGTFLMHNKSNATGCIQFSNSAWTTKNFSIRTNVTSGSIPTVTINFAGNLTDSGGPYYRPPYETTQLVGAWSDGYYTNNSHQLEGWMYINLTVTDGDGLSNVWLNWLNDTTWTNWTYRFTKAGAYYELNTSANFSTHSGYNYSFDVVANDTFGNSRTWQWNKTIIKRVAAPQTYRRRVVQLNSTAENFNYTALYFYNESYKISDPVADGLKHDGGTDGSTDAFGSFSNNNILPSKVEFVACSLSVGFWFGNESCVQNFTLDNIYYHYWYSSDFDDLDEVGWIKTRANVNFFTPLTDKYDPSSGNARSTITYNNCLLYTSPSPRD